MSIDLYALEEEVFAQTNTPKEEPVVEYDDLVSYAQDSLVDGNGSAVESFMLMSMYEMRGLESDETPDAKNITLKKIWAFIVEATKKIVERVKKFFTFINARFQDLVTKLKGADTKDADPKVVEEAITEVVEKTKGKKLLSTEKFKSLLENLPLRRKKRVELTGAAAKTIMGIKIALLSAGGIAAATKLVSEFSKKKDDFSGDIEIDAEKDFMEHLTKYDFERQMEISNKFFNLDLKSISGFDKDFDVSKEVEAVTKALETEVTRGNPRVTNEMAKHITESLQKIVKSVNDAASDELKATNEVAKNLAVAASIKAKSSKAWQGRYNKN